MNIGTLTRVSPKDVFKREDTGLSAYMVEHLQWVGDAVGLTLVEGKREDRTESAFRVDIVAQTGDGRTVIIENQYGDSDHKHLGQVLTYLAALEAEAAIWVVENPRPEHVSAVTWLNEMQGVDVFLLKLQAFTIGASDPAPLLTLIVGPSAETRAIAQENKQTSERRRKAQLWWEDLLARGDASFHAGLSAPASPFLTRSAGITGAGYRYYTNKSESRAGLYIDSSQHTPEQHKAAFAKLAMHRDAIEAAYGGPLHWDAKEGSRSCEISARFEGGFASPAEEWEAIHQQMTDAMQRLVQATTPHLNAIEFPDPAPPEEDA